MQTPRRSSKQITCSIIASCLLLTTAVSGQVGGRTTYNFLKLPVSARVTALGGTLISVSDEDNANAVLNPAVLAPESSGMLTFQNNFHFDGIYNGYAGYSQFIEKWDVALHGGVQFMQYGQFTRADAFGNTLGNFKASEMAITVGGSYAFAERLSAGANLRLINSNLESFNSFGITADIGAYYTNAKDNLSIGFVIRNVGGQISTYDGDSESVPLDIQLGLSHRLKYLPFRFSVTAHSLNRWQLRYDSPLDEQETTIIGEEPEEKSDFSKGVDNFFRHLIFSGEFLLGKNEVVKLRFAYNHQRRRELTVASLRSLAGISAGVGIKIKRFYVDYGFGAYHIAGSTHHIGVAFHFTRLQERTIVD